jgi:hypothetical protein
MTRHWTIIAAAILALTTFDAAFAGSKHRHARYRARAPVAVAPAPAFAPARMIEVRPGLIISSYDCVTDEGYGRFVPCSNSSRR